MRHSKPASLLLASVAIVACAPEVIGGGDSGPNTTTSTSSSTTTSTSSSTTTSTSSSTTTSTSASTSGSQGTGGAGTGGNASCVPACSLDDPGTSACCGGFWNCGSSSTSGAGGGGGSGSGDGTGGGCTQFCEGYATTTCTLVNGCPAWVTQECNTPLVAVFDGRPVEMVADALHGFALNARGSIVTDWPTARTPWLALDRDGNGAIDDGTELFGSMTATPDGRTAVNGFEALRALDVDGDGLVTERDPGFARLVLWADRDGDRASSAGELTPVAEAGIVAIDLRYSSEPRCDARGNCEVERAPFTWRDASGALHGGEIVDIHLRAQR